MKLFFKQYQIGINCGPAGLRSKATQTHRAKTLTLTLTPTLTPIEGEHPNERGTGIEAELFATQINAWLNEERGI